jgi:hypothetical protein
MTLATAAGRQSVRQYIEMRLRAWTQNAVRSAGVLSDPGADLIERLTLFRTRGLTFNSSVFVDFAVERALEEMKNSGLIGQGVIRRVAIIGPGLDFTDKLDGYDFYPQQTTQPFAIVDTLSRLGLGASAIGVTAFDVSPGILRHLKAARTRARSGGGYTLVLARNAGRPWAPGIVESWDRFGDRIGRPAPVPAPPASAGRAEVRGVVVRPSVVSSIDAEDLDIVVERPVTAANTDRFDLVIATNILIYYDLFDQSLALSNVAAMLRPGGVFLTNDRVFELPGSPLRTLGETEVSYMEPPTGLGDRIIWYQRP